MAKNDAEYLLGTAPEELQRLGFQHQIWQLETQSLWRQALFGPGQVVADLGCGPGFATRELARLVGPAGRVIALDAAARYVDYLISSMVALPGLEGVVEAINDDVYSLPVEDAHVDGIFVRWLLCFLERPQAAISEMARILKPGGKLVIMDYCNYLAARVLPEQPAINSVFQAYYRSTQAHGGSYDVGNLIPTWLVENGLDIQVLHPICKIGRPGSIWWQWVESFHQVFVPKLVTLGIWDDAKRSAFESAWKSASTLPGTMLFTPPMLGIVATKPFR